MGVGALRNLTIPVYTIGPNLILHCTSCCCCTHLWIVLLGEQFEYKTLDLEFTLPRMEVPCPDGQAAFATPITTKAMPMS